MPVKFPVHLLQVVEMPVVRFCRLLLALTFVLALLFPIRAEEKPAVKLPEQGGVHVFLKQHCIKCHSEDKPEGDLYLDKLAPPASNVESDKNWMLVAEALSSGQMPPPEEKRPDPAAVKFVTNSIAKALAKSNAPRPLSLRRMNRVEYENTVRELLGINTDLAEMLT